MSSARFTTAVHILTLLASYGDEPATSESIAGSVNTNPVVIRRILRSLADAGLVRSTPGTAGGSRLARDARRITLRDVYEAVESGSHFGEPSQHPNPKCPVGRRIRGMLTPRLEAAETAMAASLRKTTIADLLEEVS